MTLRLSPELDTQLTYAATSLGISKQQVVEKAIEKYLELDLQRAVARNTVEMVLQRDAELLRRLADA